MPRIKINSMPKRIKCVLILFTNTTRYTKQMKMITHTKMDTRTIKTTLYNYL